MDIDKLTLQTQELLQRQNVVEESKLGAQDLPGEDLEAPDLETANDWITVYRELVDFKETLVAAIDERQKQLRDVAARGLDRDMIIMTLQLKRYQLHLEYWQDRRHELQAELNSI